MEPNTYINIILGIKTKKKIKRKNKKRKEPHLSFDSAESNQHCLNSIIAFTAELGHIWLQTLTQWTNSIYMEPNTNINSIMGKKKKKKKESKKEKNHLWVLIQLKATNRTNQWHIALLQNSVIFGCKILTQQTSISLWESKTKERKKKKKKEPKSFNDSAESNPNKNPNVIKRQLIYWLQYCNTVILDARTYAQKTHFYFLYGTQHKTLISCDFLQVSIEGGGGQMKNRRHDEK